MECRGLPIAAHRLAGGESLAHGGYEWGHEALKGNLSRVREFAELPSIHLIWLRDMIAPGAYSHAQMVNDNMKDSHKLYTKATKLHVLAAPAKLCLCG